MKIFLVIHVIEKDPEMQKIFADMGRGFVQHAFGSREDAERFAEYMNEEFASSDSVYVVKAVSMTS